MISIIVAMDETRGIGKNNQLMWRIPGELPRFKSITMGHPLIMGRKTYASIGKPLPGRTNIVITRDTTQKIEGCVVVGSLEEAISAAEKSEGADEVFIIGGGQIFKEALPFTDRLYLTLVKGDFGADVFFPEYAMFKKSIEREDHEDGEYRYSFITLEK
jgi:dihydrofolate reductase